MHYAAVTLAAAMWGILVFLFASTFITIVYGGDAQSALFRVLWHARSHLWIPLAAWALLSPRSPGLFKWGWIPGVFYLLAYTWLGWMHFGEPTMEMGLGTTWVGH